MHKIKLEGVSGTKKKAEAIFTSAGCLCQTSLLSSWTAKDSTLNTEIWEGLDEVAALKARMRLRATSKQQ